MIQMLFILVPALMIVAYLTFEHFKTAPVARLQKRLGVKRKRGKGMQSLHNLFTAKRQLTYITIGSVVAGIYIAVAMLHATPFIGAIGGGVLPYLISEAWKERWLDRYEAGVVQALEYGAGIFKTGATVEQWVREVGSEVEGSIVTVFERGKYQVESGQFGVVDWLKYTAETTPSKFFSYVLYGLIANYEQASSLQTYMQETLAEINHRKKYERVMRQQRDEAMKLLVAISLAPVALYAMFAGAINGYLATNLTQNLIFGVGLLGYVILLLFARKTASAKPKV
nr:hypothetical protein [Bacilli bacterium]